MRGPGCTGHGRLFVIHGMGGCWRQGEPCRAVAGAQRQGLPVVAWGGPVGARQYLSAVASGHLTLGVGVVDLGMRPCKGIVAPAVEFACMLLISCLGDSWSATRGAHVSWCQQATGCWLLSIQ